MKKTTPSSNRENDRAFQKLSTSYYQPSNMRSENTEPESQAEEPVRRRFKKRYIIVPLLLIFLAIAIPLAILVTWNYQNFSSASKQLFGTSDVLAIANTKPLTSENGRVNVLLVGYSADSPGNSAGQLTDSIIVLSLDQSNPSGSYMLSVPRDLYVEISDDYGYGKINEAFQAGERSAFNETGYPSGGMGQLRKTVSESLGVELHYHALINYGAVRGIVDALGGINVTIASSDERGLYDPNFQPEEGGPLELANGQQMINGETALKLTRARGAAGGAIGFAQSDFTRTQNQQLVVGGIVSELNWRLVLDPRTNGQIFDAVAQNVVTDLDPSRVIPLYRLLTQTPAQDITSYTLRELKETNYLSSYTTRSGQSALIPRAGIDDFSEIQAAIDSL